MPDIVTTANASFPGLAAGGRPRRTADTIAGNRRRDTGRALFHRGAAFGHRCTAR